jgi:hypothetical protein
LLELVAQVLEVLVGGVEYRVAHQTLLFSRLMICDCTSATFFWNFLRISAESIGWIKIEMSSTRSRLMMGANHESVSDARV